MYPFDNSPGVKTEEIGGPLKSGAERLPEAMLFFEKYGKVLTQKVLKSVYAHTKLKALHSEASLTDVLQSLGYQPTESALLHENGWYLGSETLSPTELVQLSDANWMLLMYSPPSDTSHHHIEGLPLVEPQSLPTVNELFGNVMQRCTSQFSTFMPHSFAICGDNLKPHGQFLWFDKTRDVHAVVIGAVKGNNQAASQLAASIITILQMVVVEQGYTEADEILNRTSYLLYKLFKEKVNFSEPFVELSIAVVNRKQRLVELSGSISGTMCQTKGKVQWLKGSRAVLGDPKILLSKQDYRSTKYKLDELQAVYLYSPAVLDLYSKKHDKALGKTKLAQFLDAASKHPMQEQGFVLKDMILDWTGEDDHTPYLLLGFKAEL